FPMVVAARVDSLAHPGVLADGGSWYDAATAVAWAAQADPGIDAARFDAAIAALGLPASDRKSTRLNSSHVKISYAVFCLEKQILDGHRLDDLSTLRHVALPAANWPAGCACCICYVLAVSAPLAWVHSFGCESGE